MKIDINLTEYNLIIKSLLFFKEGEVLKNKIKRLDNLINKIMDVKVKEGIKKNLIDEKGGYSVDKRRLK